MRVLFFFSVFDLIEKDLEVDFLDLLDDAFEFFVCSDLFLDLIDEKPRDHFGDDYVAEFVGELKSIMEFAFSFADTVWFTARDFSYGERSWQDIPEGAEGAKKGSAFGDKVFMFWVHCSSYPNYRVRYLKSQ